jgi:hypothetical protein
MAQVVAREFAPGWRFGAQLTFVSIDDATVAEVR